MNRTYQNLKLLIDAGRYELEDMFEKLDLFFAVGRSDKYIELTGLITPQVNDPEVIAPEVLELELVELELIEPEPAVVESTLEPANGAEEIIVKE